MIDLVNVIAINRLIYLIAKHIILESFIKYVLISINKIIHLMYTKNIEISA